MTALWRSTEYEANASLSPLGVDQRPVFQGVTVRLRNDCRDTGSFLHSTPPTDIPPSSLSNWIRGPCGIVNNVSGRRTAKITLDIRNGAAIVGPDAECQLGMDLLHIERPKPPR